MMRAMIEAATMHAMMAAMGKREEYKEGVVHRLLSWFEGAEALLID